MVAAEEALEDAGWTPQREEDLEATASYIIPMNSHVFVLIDLGGLPGLWYWQSG
jgi:hypothetical protein